MWVIQTWCIYYLIDNSLFIIIKYLVTNHCHAQEIKKSLSILGHFGCSIPHFEGFHMVYQMTGRDRSLSVTEASGIAMTATATAHNQSWLCDHKWLRLQMTATANDCSHLPVMTGHATWPVNTTFNTMNNSGWVILSVEWDHVGIEKNWSRRSVGSITALLFGTLMSQGKSIILLLSNSSLATLVAQHARSNDNRSA